MTSRSILMAAAGSSTTAYADEVFSTYLYTGNGADQVVTNNIALNGTAAWSTYKFAGGATQNNGIAVDSSGNFYTTGYVNSNAAIYTAKYNSSGVPQWGEQRQLSTDNGRSVAVDSSGNVYVTGNVGASPTYLYVIKYNSSGVAQWQNKLVESNNAVGYGIAVDSSGNVYVTGYANDAAKDYAITAKYNSGGSLLWQQKLSDFSASGQFFVYGRGIALDSSANVYVTGYVIDSYTATDFAFIAKYNSNGGLLWKTKFSGGAAGQYNLSIALDSSGSIYTAGYSSDGFAYIIKTNSSGVNQWSRKIRFAPYSWICTGVAVDSSGNVYVSGYDVNRSYGIALKYNSSGDLQWQRQFFQGATKANGIAVDSTGKVYITGYATSGSNYAFITILNQDGTTVGGTAFVTMREAGGVSQNAGVTDYTLGTATSASATDSGSNPTGTTGTLSTTSATQAAVTGLGGMVLLKGRSGATDWAAYDTVRGTTKYLVTNSTAAQTTQTTGLYAFNIDGFSAGSLTNLNTNNAIYSSWTFAKSPKFFDVVTWTGDNTTRNISHSLGITPGMIVVKRTDSASTQGWVVWHTSTGGTNNLLLNTTAAAAPLVNGRISAATANTFTVQSGSTNIADVNATGGTYVAYLFANNTDTDGLIQCGGFTADGSGNATVTLGWEPQWVLLKRTDVANDWQTLDVFRGFTVNATNELLLPNTAGAATNGGPFYIPTATGFNAVSRGASSTNIYVAIRRPNKPPTVGTQVFQPTVYTGTNANNRLVNTTIAPDLAIARQRNDAVLAGSVVGDRLRGQPYLLTGSTAIEVTSATALDQQLVSAVEYGNAFSSMSGFYVGTDATAKLNVNTTANNHVAWAFKRAPGFFDMVCYTGTGVAKTESHNLGVVPELMIVKQRSSTVDAWIVYNSSSGNTKHLVLNTTAIPATNVNVWNSTTPTASVFTVGTDGQVNENTQTYVAYLFATLAGISKVGTYTGNGSSQTVNCGFTTGARFVLIKRTDATGDWYVWDSARGIVAGNDPYLAWNSTAAEVTTNDTVDADNSGFIVNQLAATNANVTSATYIFLAIA